MLTNHFYPLSKPVSPEICLSFQPRGTLHLQPTLRPRRFSLSAGKDKSGLVFRKSEFGDMDTPWQPFKQSRQRNVWGYSSLVLIYPYPAPHSAKISKTDLPLRYKK